MFVSFWLSAVCYLLWNVLAPFVFMKNCPTANSFPAVLQVLSYCCVVKHLIYTVSQKKQTTAINMTWVHQLTTVTNYFGGEWPYSIISWCDKKFLNWLRTSCMVSITTVATWHQWHNWTVNFWWSYVTLIVAASFFRNTVVKYFDVSMGTQCKFMVMVNNLLLQSCLFIWWWCYCLGSREKKVHDPLLLISVADQLCCHPPRHVRARLRRASLLSPPDISTMSTSPCLQRVKHSYNCHIFVVVKSYNCSVIVKKILLEHSGGRSHLW